MDLLLPGFNKKRKESLDWCITNGNYSNGDGTLCSLNLSSAEKLTNIKAVLELDISTFSRTWRNDVQAIPLEIPDDLLDVAGKVVWFQCPWIPRNETKYKTSTLIKGFMEAMEERQQVGDYLLIGITQHDAYFQEYNLEEMQLEQEIYGYRFKGADKELIKKILGRGYKHEAYKKDIHDYIFNEHEILVFKKTSEEDLADRMGNLAINDDDLLVTRVTTKEVVVFNEEDRSFTAALAEMHDKKLNGIKTGYLSEDPSDNHYISMILHQCVINGEKAHLHPAEIIENIESHLQLVYTGKVVWYQLPLSCDVKMEQIESFMRSIGKKQVTGDYLLIGTTTSSQFTAFKNGGMIGDGSEGHAYNGYQFIRIDVKLINMLTARGYKHGSTNARVLVYEKVGRGAERKGMTPKPKAK